MVIDDEYFMRQAIVLAKEAEKLGEVPIGAIVVCNNKIIGKGYNLCERLKDATAHAEMQAFSAACEYLGSKYLMDASLYVTLEPCPMCMGAAYWLKIGKIVYGASDPKRGYKSLAPSVIHPNTEIKTGVLEKECKEVLQNFFRQKR